MIALGLLAGWSVPGLIEEGWFNSAQRESSDPLQLVGSLLNRPAGRLAPLNPAARQLAMGTVSEASSGSTAASSSFSYALAVPREPRENQDAFMKVLNERRRQNGKGPAALAPDLRDAALSIAGKLEQGRMSVEDAQDALLAQSGAPGRARGWRLEVHRLETMPIPRDVLNSTQLRIAVVVAHHKPTGRPGPSSTSSSPCGDCKEEP